MAVEMKYANIPIFQSLSDLPAIQVSNAVEVYTPHKPLEIQVSQATAQGNRKVLTGSPVVKADQYKLFLWPDTDTPNNSMEDAPSLNSHLTVVANE